MKNKLIIILTAVLLNGCALWDAYNLTHYDPNEYLLITKVRVDAMQYKTQCETVSAVANATQISYETELFEKYSEQIPANSDSYKASKSLNEIAKGLVAAYEKGPVSPLFCKLKYGSIENSAYVIQHVIAGRPR